MSEAFGVEKFRKDFGDLEELAASMEEFNQIHEIVKTSDGVTIDGDRREAAFNQFLKGKSKKITKLREYRIPLTFKELQETGLFSLMQVEANTQRKSFTIAEIDKIRKHIEKIRKSGNLPERFKGIETREITGKITHHGSRNIQKIADIMEAVDTKKIDEKYIKRIAEGLTSINTVHNMATYEKISLPRIEIPKNKYNILYLDPPWQYENKNTGGSMQSGSIAKYPTMSMEELKEFGNQVKEITANDAVCFLWVTVPLIKEGFELLEYLGFDYKTMISWRKIMSLGMGYWFRGQMEHLLVGVKGKVKPFRCQNANFIQTKVGKHSEKPEEFRKLIEEATKNIQPQKRIEFFARKTTKNWTSWGNEIINVDFGKETILKLKKGVSQKDVDKVLEKIPATSKKEMSPIEKLRNKKK